MFKRRLPEHTDSLQDRLTAFANKTREEASKMRPGAERDEMIRKARRADTASYLDAWVSSPGLQPPK
jgi:hypothetical protein